MAQENGDGAGGSSNGREGRTVAPDGGDVLGDHGVDDEELRARTERAGSTIDPAATEKSVETRDGGMDTGQDGPEDEDREQADRSAGEEIDLESALSDALDDEGDVLQQTASSTDHAVGEGDPDDLFEEFDEDSPEELIEAADEPDESEDDVDVSGLFEDLGEVEESTASATETAGTEPETAPDTEGPEELLMGDTDETAGEIEGLLGDLTTVDVDDTDTSGTGTAHTEPTILSTEEARATGFQWLGEDIQIFPSDGDPDAVFDEFEEETPEELIDTADDAVTATGLFDDLADGEVTYPDVDARTGGWSADDATSAGVRATALFDRMTTAVDPPRPASTDADADDDTDVTTFGPDTAGSETTDASLESPTDSTGTETDPADAGTGTDDGLDLDLDLDTDTADSAGAGGADTADTGAAETDDGLDLDLDLDTGGDTTEPGEDDTDAGSVDIDLDGIDEVGSDAGTEAEARNGNGNGTGTGTGTETAGAGSVDAGTPVEETGSELDFDFDLDEPGDAGTNGTSAGAGPAADSHAEAEPEPEPEPEPDTEPEAPDGAVAAESDVDAVFERFDEGSPEELIAAAETESESTPVEGIEPSEEHIDDLFGDLSAVSLTPEEREKTSQETGEALEPGSDETVAAIEGLLGDMSPADVPETMGEDDTGKEPTAGGEEPTFAAEAEGEPDLGDGDGHDPDGLEQTSEDTHVAVGDSDIDAFFERFNESSPEEIAESARVPPLEELSERDPERVRDQIGEDTERTPEIDDDDPVEVLGPDDGDDESLSGAIREDLGAGTEFEDGDGDGDGNGDHQSRRHDQNGRETDDELSGLDPDDIFEDAGGRERGTGGFGDRSATETETETETDTGTTADRTPEVETESESGTETESSGVTMNGEDLVSDARQGGSGSTERTNSERVGEALTDADAGAGAGAETGADATGTSAGSGAAPETTGTEVESRPESESESVSGPGKASESESGASEAGDEGIVARIVSKLRGLF